MASADTLATPASGHGITVTGMTRVEGLQRTWEVTMTDPAVDATYATLDHSLRVRITLPEGYASSGRSYPTLYLLHGQDAGADQWTTSGDAEQITAGRDVIVVTPEGGKAGWYTDWVNDGAHRQDWEQFHVRDLVPWVDDSFRTLASKEHRAIGGLSMGGYGALHYAFAHPDTYGHVSAYSPAADTEDQAIRTAVVGSVTLQGMGLGDGPFGSPVWPFDGAWKAANPVRHADQLRGTSISLYAGDGLGSDPLESNLIERFAGNSTHTLAKTLAAQGIPHYWEMYGHDVSAGGYTCTGGHNWGCWKMSFSKDIGRIMNAIG
ncbi:hypothetical protein VV01_11080 [Luteipulveratus halotolerans]|uniref:Esterase n=2 Tax=Luteipulveratus halotolerans TaxID=1631356 RepID=A0A0L6CNT2_9MICO|nr:hypothetical protein VV01_11080 [Luteipulveratus halotolerans]